VDNDGSSLRWSEVLSWDTDECLIDNGGCGDSSVWLCENRCGSWPLCHSDVGSVDFVAAVSEQGRQEQPVDTGRQLCGGSKKPNLDNLELQLNMSNPTEHCDLGWENWCLEEGGHLEYTITLGQQPEADIQVLVSGEFLQTNETVVFTVDDFHEPHIVRLNLLENTRSSGHYWMHLIHTVSFVNVSFGHRWWTTREPAVLRAGWTQPVETWDHRIHDGGFTFDNATSWMPGRLLASDGRIFPLVVPVLITDNEVERSLHMLMAVEYSTILDMDVFCRYFQRMLGIGLGITPNRVIVDDVIVAGLMTRRLAEVVNPDAPDRIGFSRIRGRRQLEGTEIMLW
jgi:hypothetical protein